MRMGVGLLNRMAASARRKELAAVGVHDDAAPASDSLGIFAQSQHSPIVEGFVTRASARLDKLGRTASILSQVASLRLSSVSRTDGSPILRFRPFFTSFSSVAYLGDGSLELLFLAFCTPSRGRATATPKTHSIRPAAKMFSPTLHEGGPAKGTRSSRRRQRHPSADSSVQQPKAKRQRVPLSETTFANPDSQPDMYEVKPDKIDLHSTKRDGIENAGAPRKELSVRSKKPKPGERTSKGDGSIVLVRLPITAWTLPCASS